MKMFKSLEIAKIERALSLLRKSDGYNSGNRIETEMVEEYEARIYQLENAPIQEIA